MDSKDLLNVSNDEIRRRCRRSFFGMGIEWSPQQVVIFSAFVESMIARLERERSGAEPQQKRQKEGSQ